MKTFPLSEIKRAAKNRPPGYLEECLASGNVVGDNIQIEDEKFYLLKKKYSQPLPALSEMLTHFGEAVKKWRQSGYVVAEKSEFDSRLNICRSCFDWAHGRCRRCGCCIVKQWIKSEKCPDGKW